MGLTGSKPFERNDKIPGQGRSLMLDCKALGLKSRQLDRLYREFCRFEDVTTYRLDMESLLSAFRIDMGMPLLDALLLKFDASKTGEVLFHDFVLTFWDFLTTSDGDLFANFMFQHIDTNSTNVVEVFEVKFMINLAWKFNPNREATKALGKLDKNEDGFVTMVEFALLYRHFPAILKPVIKVRETLRKKIAYWRFWKEMTDFRKNEFYARSIFDILDRRDAKECRLSALQHVVGRIDVPVAFADRWRDTMRKKADTCEKKENMELPAELWTEEETKRHQEKMVQAAEDEKRRKADSKLFKRHGPHLDFTSDESLMNDNADERIDELLAKLSSQKFKKSAIPSKKHAAISP